MTTVEIRCTASHPRNPTRACNAKLFDAIDGTVVVIRSAQVLGIGPGCSIHSCPRCGTSYVIAPRTVVSTRAVG